MILTWTTGLSESFGFRAKVAKELSRVWGDVRNTGAGPWKPLAPPPCTAPLLSDVQPAPQPPEPQSLGLFHGDVLCPAYPRELS